MEQKKKIIGITGGVGAGKSSVLAVLKEDFGAKIILADLVAHDLMEPGSLGLRKVTEALGTSFLTPDGAVDRKALADLIFRDKEALKTMNSIIHPLVWKTMKEEAEAVEACGKLFGKMCGGQTMNLAKSILKKMDEARGKKGIFSGGDLIKEKAQGNQSYESKVNSGPELFGGL